jgi:tRNA(fMet)-specific endonuclease VapC
LLDTDALSEPLRPRPSLKFMARLRAAEGRVALAAVSWHEALFGLERLPPGERREHVRAYLFEVIAPAVPVLPYDARAAAWHAVERARLEAVGRVAPFADGQIAAVAHVHGLGVVTRNSKHFRAFRGVKLERWW